MEKHSVLIMAPEGISLLRCKDDLIEMLGSKGIYRTTAKHQCRYIDVETDHVAIRIIPYDFKDFDGMRYDECFGVPPHISCRLTKNGIAGRQLIDTPDYICQIEREASESVRCAELSKAFAEGLQKGIEDSSASKAIADVVKNAFHKCVINSVYGKCPKPPDWVQEVFSEAAKNGTIKPRLTKFSWYTKEEIDKILNQPILNPNYYIQNQIYAALMKGENNMDKVMKDITLGKPAYLATENGRVPVRIETCTMSTLEPARFEGHVLTLADTLATYYSMSSGKRVGSGPRPRGKLPGIKTVHFSGPVTAVIWEDKTKTIVRCKEGEVPDYEKGFAMAIAKKALGTNKSGSNYYDIFKKYLPKPEVEEEHAVEETVENVVEEE